MCYQALFDGLILTKDFVTITSNASVTLRIMRLSGAKRCQRASGVEIAPALSQSVHRWPVFLDLQVRDHTAGGALASKLSNASEELTIWQGTLPGGRSKFAAKRPGAYRQDGQTRPLALQ